MDLVLDSEALRLPQGNPVDVALKLLEKEDDVFVALFDLSEAQFFDGQGINFITFVVSGFVLKVFQELGLNCREPTEDEKKKKGLKPIDILNLVSKYAFVYDPDGIVKIPGNKRSNFFLSKKMPQRPNVFRHIIKIVLEKNKTEVKIFVDDIEDPRRISCLNPRFYADLSRIIDEIIQKGSRKAEIVMPNTQNGKTTLIEEITWAKSLIRKRLASYSLPPGSLEEKILRILSNHCDKSVAIEINEDSRLRKLVRASIEIGAPIPISITIAHGMRVPNGLKNKNRFGPPTFAWLYNLIEFSLINQEIRKVFPRGVIFYLFEEGYIFHQMFGVDLEVVERNIRVTQRLIDELEAPVIIFPLLPEYFPSSEVEKVSIPKPTDEEVFSMLCSIEEMEDKEIMDLVYMVRKKNYAWVQNRVGSLWEKAQALAETKNKILKYRKDINLYPKIISKKTGENVENRVIDAAVTEKEGRFSFKLTGLALFNHGAAVVERNVDGKLTCWVVPEYRLEKGIFQLQDKKMRVKPIRIKLSEFGVVEVGEIDYIWCYEVH